MIAAAPRWTNFLRPLVSEPGYGDLMAQDEWRNAKSQALHNLGATQDLDQALAELTEADEDALRETCGQLLRVIRVDGRVDARHRPETAKAILAEAIAANRRSMEVACLVEQHAPQWMTIDGGRIDNVLSAGPGRWWDEYSNKLLSNKGLSREVVSELLEHCLQILNRGVKAPAAEDLLTKTMVIGNVQSGKTASMAGIIALAADAGYNMFIVLSGTKENLRKQTNSRLIQDLQSQAAGLVFHPFTSPDNNGWTLGAHQTFDPFITAARLSEGGKIFGVVLKNGTRLRTLRTSLQMIRPATKRQIRCLLIDDECDEASVNGGFDPDVPAEDQTPAIINGLIRDLVHGALTTEPERRQGHRVGYLAYTATPFANVLNEPPTPANPSLYPETYIHHLPRPGDYIGSREIFGDAESSDELATEGIGYVSTISHEDAELCTARLEPDSAPASLALAVAWFVLATAERWERALENGKDVPYSTMLVHVKPNVAHHDRTHRWVQKIIQDWRSHNTAFLAAMADACSLSGVVTPQRLLACLPRYSDITSLATRAGPRPWSDAMAARARAVLNEIVSIIDNGQQVAEARLAYPRPYRPENGRFFVVHGGATLSRGLTLEGLVSSYFVREAHTMDTQMQMGRWFGFRHGYEDLPRIWLSDRLQASMTEIVSLERELEVQVRFMRESGNTPNEYGIRLRADAGMKKLTRNDANAIVVEEDYSGLTPQTILFKNNETFLKENWNAAKNLISELCVHHQQSSLGGRIVWKGVKASRVVQFLRRYKTTKEALAFDSSLISDFLERQLVLDSGLLFNVVLMGGDSEENTGDSFGAAQVAYVSRSRMKDEQDRADTARLRSPAFLNIKALRGSADVLADAEGIARPAGTVSDMVEERFSRGLPPLLCLYPIHKNSQPKSALRDRAPLLADHHVLGVMMVFPRGSGEGERVIAPNLDDDEEAEDAAG